MTPKTMTNLLVFGTDALCLHLRMSRFPVADAGFQ